MEKSIHITIIDEFNISYLVGAAGVAVLVVLDEGQESVDGRRALDDVLDAVVLRTVLKDLSRLGAMDFTSGRKCHWYMSYFE